MEFVESSRWRQQRWRGLSRISPTDEVWLHHGASGSPTLATLRAYERYHVGTLGWSALGYSWAVTGDGTVYEGRGWLRAGAHTSGRNRVSHGIVLVGDWSTGTVPTVMVDAVARILRHGQETGAIPGRPRIDGHRNAPGASTACPGWAGMQALPKIRRQAASTAEDIMATLDDDDIRNIAEATADRVWAEIIGHGADMRASTLLSRLQGGGIDDVLDAVGRIPARTAGRIAADLPDGSDVVWTADNDVDEGIAMAAAQASGGTYRRWGGGTIDAEHVAAVGRVGDVADVGSGEVTVLQGADRGETAGLAVGFASRLLAES